MIYGRSYGKVWVCPDWPDCDHYCGCHPKSQRSLSLILPGPELREARKRAHAWFDPIWKHGPASRNAAYRWLAHGMNMTRDDCHIGLFDVEQCNRAATLCKERTDDETRTAPNTATGDAT